MVVQELIDLNQGVIDACNVNATALAAANTANAAYETAYGNLDNAISGGNLAQIQAAWAAFGTAKDTLNSALSEYFESQKAVVQNAGDAFPHLTL